MLLPVTGYPRDMKLGHRLTITPLDAFVAVSVGGQEVASSHRPVLLEETGLPPRYYLPPADVRTDLLRRSQRHTTCPFKGRASYWSLEADGQVHEDIAWSYERPKAGVEEIAGLICFANERVELHVDERAPAAPRARAS